MARPDSAVSGVSNLSSSAGPQPHMVPYSWQEFLIKNRLMDAAQTAYSDANVAMLGRAALPDALSMINMTFPQHVIDRCYARFAHRDEEDSARKHHARSSGVTMPLETFLQIVHRLLTVDFSSTAEEAQLVMDALAQQEDEARMDESLSGPPPPLNRAPSRAGLSKALQEFNIMATTDELGLAPIVQSSPGHARGPRRRGTVTKREEKEEEDVAQKNALTMTEISHLVGEGDEHAALGRRQRTNSLMGSVIPVRREWNPVVKPLHTPLVVDATTPTPDKKIHGTGRAIKMWGKHGHIHAEETPADVVRQRLQDLKPRRVNSAQRRRMYGKDVTIEHKAVTDIFLPALSPTPRDEDIVHALARPTSPSAYGGAGRELSMGREDSRGVSALSSSGLSQSPSVVRQLRRVNSVQREAESPAFDEDSFIRTIFDKASRSALLGCPKGELLKQRKKWKALKATMEQFR